jgi:hypothetical protein
MMRWHAKTAPLPANQISENQPDMFTSRPCKATCVVDGSAVQISFYPDTGILRIADAARASVRETRWGASWNELLKAFAEFSHRGQDDLAVESLFSGALLAQ